MSAGTNKTNYYFECVNCKMHFTPVGIHYLCPTCSASNSVNAPPKGVLKTLYDYDNLAGTLSLDSLADQGILPLLPINNFDNLPKLRVGNTPLYEQKKLDGQPLPYRLFLKDDSQNPSFSFKDRASSLVSAFAKENGIDTIIAASTGNAGSSIAGMCANQGQQAIVLVPEKAPIAKLMQIVMYGARLIPVRGNYDGAFDLSIEASNSLGWYNRNTAYNPLTIEGKKTVSFELVQQLKGLVPDIIFVPTGDGVIISGVYKGFEDLLKLGLINEIPLIVAVQSGGSDNLVRNLDNDIFEVKESHTLADSISVDVPRNFYMAKQFIQKYKGEGLAISDQEILHASKKLSRNTGLFTEPASAAAFGGFLRFKAENKIPRNSRVVVLLTGSGLKDLETLKSWINIPKAIKPEIKCLSQVFSKPLKTQNS